MKAYQQGITVLLISVVLLCLSFELFARFALPTMSQLVRRVNHEKELFLLEGGRTYDQSKRIVIIGNSLLLWGVDIPLLNYLGSGRFRYSRFVVENTQYWDWYFGLRRLLGEGARPSAVVLLLGSNHWLGRSIAGEYSAYSLIKSADIFLLQKKLQLDRTEASRYWFASWSSWLGNRASVRKQVLRLLFPDIELFTRRLKGGATYPEYQYAYEEMISRLLQLKTVCGSFGVDLVIALHPTLDKREPFETVIDAGRAVRVPVVAPVYREFSRTLYADGFHLNRAGMEAFTQELVNPLEEQLESLQSRLATRPSGAGEGSR